AGRHGPAADRCAHGLDVPVLQLQEARPAKALELPGADPHRGDRPGRLLHPLRDLPDPRGALHPVRPGELADRAIARRQPAGEPGEPREHRASAHPGDGPVSGITILNPANLLGKELIETIESRATQWREIRLLSTREDEIGTLTDLGGAAGLVARYEPERLNGISTVYLCGPIAANRPLFDDLPPGATGVVLSPDATSEDGVPVVAGVNTEAAHPGTILVSPHPAVILLAHLLHPLRELHPESAVATVIQPASMYDNPGLEELFEQTRGIVAISGQRPSPIFGAQLAFNLLPTTAAALPLAATLRSVLGGELPVALQVVQGGIFHSLSASLHLRFPEKTTAQALRKAWNGHPYLELAEHPKRLGPIDAAANDKVLYGTIHKDDLGGFWIWAVMDNLTRGGALNAVEIVEAIQ